MRLNQLIQILEELAPPSLQENYDNSGLLVGDPEMTVTAAMICLDSTEEVILDAVNSGCNLVIAHHPIVFSGLKRLTGSNYIERTIITAIKNGVAIYAIHTNLDNVIEGVNAEIARRIGLKNTTILNPIKGKLLKLVVFCPDEAAEELRTALFKAGAGQIGLYDECSYSTSGNGTFRANEGADPYVGKVGSRHTEAEQRIEVILPEWKLQAVLSAMNQAHPYEEVAYDLYRLENAYQKIGAGMIGDLEQALSEREFLLMLKEKMDLKTIRFTSSRNEKIQKVAVCGGSGSFLLQNAIRAGAQAFVTADFKYHQFFDAEQCLVIADIGHFESERFTMNLLASYISGKFPKFAVRFTQVNTNPVNYL